MSKETFKIFARTHPELASFVISGESSWQKLYELYDIYGDSSEVWSKYISKATNLNSNSNIGDTPLREVFQNIKNMDMDSFQKGIENLQKTVGLLQEIGLGGQSNYRNQPYQPRPFYQRLED